MSPKPSRTIQGLLSGRMSTVRCESYHWFDQGSITVPYDADTLSVHENGSSALLLNVRGTLPVAFRGTTYAFPISIWVPHDYPEVGPIGFVTPTEGMAVRAGQYVSGEGRIYHPYLANWTAEVSTTKQGSDQLQLGVAIYPGSRCSRSRLTSDF